MDHSIPRYKDVGETMEVQMNKPEFSKQPDTRINIAVARMQQQPRAA